MGKPAGSPGGLSGGTAERLGEDSMQAGAERACRRGVVRGSWLPRSRGVLSGGLLPDQVQVAGEGRKELEWPLSRVSPDLYRPFSQFRRWEDAEQVAGQYLKACSRAAVGGGGAQSAGQEPAVNRAAPLGALVEDVAILTGHLRALGALQRDVHRVLSSRGPLR